MDKLQAFVSEQLKKEVPEVKVGDTVKVHDKIKEGNRERIQIFEGTVIAKRGGGISETFTVRRVSYGVGVEKTFPIHSPHVEKVETVRHGKVRRAKLYYLRDRVGKRSKVKEQIVWILSQAVKPCIFCQSKQIKLQKKHNREDFKNSSGYCFSLCLILPVIFFLLCLTYQLLLFIMFIIPVIAFYRV